MPLRPYQQEAVTKILAHFKENGKSCPLVVLPTGAGKTHVLGGLCKKIHRRWPNQSVLILSHVQEILQQDYNSLRDYLPHSKLGIYSAGLGKRQVRQFTIAGVQSVWNKADLFRNHKLIIIDEAHLVPASGEGRYRSLIKDLGNPSVLGLTATPYRLGLGCLTDGDIFDSIIYNKDVLELIKDGYLCNLSTKATKNRMDTRDIPKALGDFKISALSSKLDKYAVTSGIISEVVKHKDTRKSWLLFGIDIDHAEHINEELTKQGILSACIHSKSKTPRGDIIDLFKAGGFQALVSVETLITGFDAPNVDLIALMRPTTSPVLHVQMVGRGLRLALGKTDCLVLDFAGNTERLGPINDVKIPVKGISKGTGKVVTKTCPECEEVLSVSTRYCPCGYEFPRRHNLEAESGGMNILGKRELSREVSVGSVAYSKYLKSGTVASMLVTYTCGLRSIKEWVPIEHLGFPGHKARHWMKYHGVKKYPKTVDEALKRQGEFNIPIRIVVDETGKYPQVKQYIY